MTAMADNYKILYLNSNHILINGKPAKVGVEFNEKAVIKWTEDRQAIKVIETNSHVRYLMVARLNEGNNLTPEEILTRNKHLSTHDDATTTNNIIKLKSDLEDSYDLLDVIEIPTKLIQDKSHYFLCTYQYGDTKLTKKLTNDQNALLIDKTIFMVDGKKLEPRDIILSISYVDGNPDTPIFIKKNINIVIIPEEL